MQVRTILLSIQSLLGEPNNDSPLNTQAAELWSNQVNTLGLYLITISKYHNLYFFCMNAFIFLFNTVLLQVAYKKHLLEKYERDTKGKAA